MTTSWIDWQAFTPISLLGGFIIGIATVLLLLGIGRIAGISGIIGNGIMANTHAFLTKQKTANSSSQSNPEYWQWLFIAGLIVAPLIYQLFSQLPTMTITESPVLLIIAGLIVGFGTRLGSGCTSGHGICGNARLSIRSLSATVTFMAVGMLTVFVARHLFNII